jgi:hypothetical protein
VARMVRMKNIVQFLPVNPEKKRTLCSQECLYGENIKTNRKEIDIYAWTGPSYLKMGVKTSSFFWEHFSVIICYTDY